MNQWQLDRLPTGTVIECQILEYEGTYQLTNTEDCCGGWHDFIVIDGEIEIVDDFTPDLNYPITIVEP